MKYKTESYFQLARNFKICSVRQDQIFPILAWHDVHPCNADHDQMEP